MDENEDKSSTLNAVVIVTQRSLDVPTSLHHSSQYQALVAEHFSLKQNKATLQDKTYYLDPMKDAFWKTNMWNDFPTVTENIDREIVAWKKDFEAMSQRQNTEDVGKAHPAQRVCPKLVHQP